ncbi:MAG: SCO family protein [Brevibacillus sp.]|nr:SCO family protein [Brevibacillus sp.]
MAILGTAGAAALALLLTGVFSTGTATPKLGWKVSDFTFVDQEGQPFGLSNLKGDIWLADFIFTNCNTVCPPMTANMADLQRQLAKEGIQVQIVSFSVDPAKDTPDVLKEFGRAFDADLSRWHFLTGYSLDEIQKLALESFKTSVQPAADSDQVVHGTSFYLVDQAGYVAYRYDGLNPPYETIINDIKTLR